MSAFIHKVFHPFISPSSNPQDQALSDPGTNLVHPTSLSTTMSTTLSPNTLQPVTIIELFQSQGCNSCPPANAFLVARASSSSLERNSAKPEELLLTYEVTYWDYLGWTDTFGDARWDARQTAYARALRQRSCYTPQVIVNGGATPIGNSSWRGLDRVLAAGAAAGKAGARIQFESVNGGSGIKILSGTGTAVVQVVFYEAEPKPVRILSGENRGETERYRNVVRDLVVIGYLEGGELVLELPARRDGLEMAVLVQAGSGGHILGAVKA